MTRIESIICACRLFFPLAFSCDVRGNVRERSNWNRINPKAFLLHALKVAEKVRILLVLHISCSQSPVGNLGSAVERRLERVHDQASHYVSAIALKYALASIRTDCNEQENNCVHQKPNTHSGTPESGVHMFNIIRLLFWKRAHFPLVFSICSCVYFIFFSFSETCKNSI